MPFYDYVCSQCSHEMEAHQRMSEDALVTCPACGKDGLERLVAQSSFALKGGGWYADGYGDGGTKGGDGKNSDSSGASATSDGPDKTETKTETKAETKTETKTESAGPTPQSSSGSSDA